MVSKLTTPILYNTPPEGISTKVSSALGFLKQGEDFFVRNSLETLYEALWSITLITVALSGLCRVNRN